MNHNGFPLRDLWYLSAVKPVAVLTAVNHFYRWGQLNIARRRISLTRRRWTQMPFLQILVAVVFTFWTRQFIKTNGRPLIESLWQFTKFCRKSVVMYAKINANSSENLPGKGNMFIYYKMADNAEFSFHTVCLWTIAPISEWDCRPTVDRLYFGHFW